MEIYVVIYLLTFCSFLIYSFQHGAITVAKVRRNHIFILCFTLKFLTSKPGSRREDLRDLCEMLGLHLRGELIIDSSNRSRGAEGEDPGTERPGSIQCHAITSSPASSLSLEAE